MKKCLCLIFLFVIAGNLFAEEDLITFRLAYEYEKPDTFAAFDKHVGKLFVQNVPLIGAKDISGARVIVDETKPPEWLSSAVTAAGSRIPQPQIRIAFTLHVRGREKLSKITADNVGNRIAIFINNELVMAPQIMERIDSEEVFIANSFTEVEARAIVDKINDINKRR